MTVQTELWGEEEVINLFRINMPDVTNTGYLGLIRQLRINGFYPRPIGKECIDTFWVEVFVAL
jgi:hypothetical protein